MSTAALPENRDELDLKIDDALDRVGMFAGFWTRIGVVDTGIDHNVRVELALLLTFSPVAPNQEQNRERTCTHAAHASTPASSPDSRSQDHATLG